MGGLQRVAGGHGMLEIEWVAQIAQPRLDLAGHGDGLPALRQDHQQIKGRIIRAQPQGLRDGHGHQHMRGIDRAGAQQVARLRPAARADQRQVQPLLGGESQFVGDDQGGGVGQRQIAKAQALAHVSRPAAITSCCAISATRRFWSIAVRRSRA